MLLCIAQLHTQAQTTCNFIINVSVVETHNFEPLYPVVLHIDELNTSYQTDEDGKVSIQGICTGNYTFHLQAMGYEPVAERVTVAGNAELRFRMAHTAQSLQEVQVTEERSHTLLQSKSQLNAATINANSGKTLGAMLQAVNGVSVLSNGATIAKPVIHGLHSNRILMLNNGVRQEDQQWGGEHAPNIDPFLANNITVLKGAAGVRYGTDALGGVVLVEPAPVRTLPGTDAELNLAGFSNNRMGVASAMVQHSFSKAPALGIRLQGTLKQGGNYQTPGGYWIANTGVREQNYSATIAYRKAHHGAELFYSHFNTHLGIYRGSHTGSKEDLDRAINSPVPLVPATFSYDIARPRQHVTHDLGKAKVYADTRIGMFNLVYAYQHNYRQEYDVVRTDDGKAQLNLTLNTQTLNLNLDHKPLGNVKGQVGLDGIYQENFSAAGDRLFIPNYRSLGIAGYAIERWQHNQWTLEAGLRYDYRNYDVYNPEGANQQVVHYRFDYSSVSGTFGASYQARPNWVWSLTLANAWRAPQANELFSSGLHHGAARIELGDKTLSPERAYSLNLESKYTLSTRLVAEVSFYSQYIRDYIFLQPGADLLTIRGYFKTFTYGQTDAWMNGVDATLQYHWNSYLETELKGSFLRARNVTANDWLILIPADRLSLHNQYTRSISPMFQDCFVGADVRYVFTQSRVPAGFDSIDHPRPPAAYWLLDASAGATLHIGRQRVFASLSVTNVLNTRYRDYLDAFRYFIDQPGTNVALRIRVPINFTKTAKPS